MFMSGKFGQATREFKVRCYCSAQLSTNKYLGRLFAHLLFSPSCNPTNPHYLLNVRVKKSFLPKDDAFIPLKSTAYSFTFSHQIFPSLLSAGWNGPHRRVINLRLDSSSFLRFYINVLKIFIAFPWSMRNWIQPFKNPLRVGYGAK